MTDATKAPRYMLLNPGDIIEKGDEFYGWNDKWAHHGIHVSMIFNETMRPSRRPMPVPEAEWAMNPNYPEWMDETEAKIIDAIIDHALSQGMTIDVRDAYGDNDEEITPLSDGALIRAEVAATGETLFDFRRAGETKAFGWVTLVHGNGYDVICDYSDNEATNSVLQPANDLAEKLSEES